LRFQNLWNLINVFQICFYENVHLNVSYDFKNSMGLGKSLLILRVTTIGKIVATPQYSTPTKTVTRQVDTPNFK
jgi:hypothetical protein